MGQRLLEVRKRLMPPLLILAAVTALAVSARHVERLPVQPPPCLFHKITTVPCPGCGGTRALQALGHADVLEALRLNPMVVLFCAAIAGWALWVLGSVAIRGRRRRVPASSPSRSARVWPVVITGIVVLHWAYLVLFFE